MKVNEKTEALELNSKNLQNLLPFPNLIMIPLSIATDYGLDDREVGVRVPVGSRIFSSPNRPDRLWGPPNLLTNGYRGRGFFSRG
jgi:hypothetical protein